MKRENDEITDLFRSRLGNAEMTVRDGFWEELNSEVMVRCHRRKVFFFRVAAAASVLLVLAASSAAFWFFSPKEEIEEAFTQVAVVSGNATHLDGDVVKQEFTPVHSEPVLSKPTPKRFGTLAQYQDEDDDSVSVTVSMSFSFSATTTRRGQNNHPDKNYWQAGGDGQTLVNSADESPSSDYTAMTAKARTWAVKAAVGTALPAGDGKYKMPVTVGLTVEKKINKHLAVETGLLYSSLRAGQNLHYLGIPVKLNVTLAEMPKLDIYASVGGVADKCIAGAPDNSFKQEPVQLALTAGVGVNYKINDKLALFAEPGVSHHFKTDSKLETVRSARPTNFNLICGLRMTY